MIKRLSWFVTGTGFGVAASIWARRKIRAKVNQVRPIAISRALLDSAAASGTRLSAAIAEARNEARSAERVLRKEMGLTPHGRSKAE